MRSSWIITVFKPDNVLLDLVDEYLLDLAIGDALHHDIRTILTGRARRPGKYPLIYIDRCDQSNPTAFSRPVNHEAYGCQFLFSSLGSLVMMGRSGSGGLVVHTQERFFAR